MERALLLTITAAVAVAALASIGMTATKSTAGSTSAGVPLTVIGGSRAKGLAFFQLRGQSLKYSVVVYNLTPNTRHAVHIHGPAGVHAEGEEQGRRRPVPGSPLGRERRRSRPGARST